MVSSKGFLDFVLDCLSHLEGISSRAMFGGYGLYQHGVIFAMIANDTLYLKVDDSNRADFEKYDSKPFTYERDGKKKAMSYYELPADILEDQDQIGHWVEKSYQLSYKKKK
jgi:DNA transformation protein and related proteins